MLFITVTRVTKNEITEVVEKRKMVVNAEFLAGAYPVTHKQIPDIQTGLIIDGQLLTVAENINLIEMALESRNVIPAVTEAAVAAE